MKTLDLPIQRISYPVGENMDEATEYINEVAKILINNKYCPRTNINIFCMGSSGTILSSLLYSKLITYCNYITIIHIKKEGETSHSPRIREFDKSRTNIIIDDFTETGSTLKRIITAIGRISIDYVIMSDIDSDTFHIVQDLKPNYVLSRKYSNECFNMWLHNHPIKIQEQQDIPL